MDWFRLHHNTHNDPKLSMIAKKVGAKRCEMTAFWECLLDHASQHEDRGFVGDADLEVIAFTQEIDLRLVQIIYEELVNKAVIIDDFLANWDKRQPVKEDTTATERKRRERARKKAESDGFITPCHDMSRDVTTDKIRLDEIINKKNITKKENENPVEQPPPEIDKLERRVWFDEWYSAYPECRFKRNKGGALREYFMRAKNEGERQALLAALTAQIEEKNLMHQHKLKLIPEWPSPANWLKGEYDAAKVLVHSQITIQAERERQNDKSSSQPSAEEMNLQHIARTKAYEEKRVADEKAAQEYAAAIQRSEEKYVRWMVEYPEIDRQKMHHMYWVRACTERDKATEKEC